MAESWGRGLKPPVDGLFYEIFGFGSFFRYHYFKNEIDAWENTVPRRYKLCKLFCLTRRKYLKIVIHPTIYKKK